MQADAITAAAGVTSAIRQAAQRTGADFQYLLATARIESNLNPAAAAPTSSAAGLYQFIDQTWLSTLKQAGPALGYGAYAEAIQETSPGQFAVADPRLRNAVMQLRNDPVANAMMAGIHTRQNAAKLGNALGRSASEGELYMAHFLGQGGAARLIQAAAGDPEARAADLFPQAAQTNRSIFYGPGGQARSVGQVYGLLAGKYQAARAGTAMPTVPDTAGARTVYAATVGPERLPVDDGPVFHSLFRGGERPQPVAPLVNELWSPQNAAAARPSAATGQSAGPPAAQPGLLNLFQNQPMSARKLFEGGV